MELKHNLKNVGVSHIFLRLTRWSISPVTLVEYDHIIPGETDHENNNNNNEIFCGLKEINDIMKPNLNRLLYCKIILLQINKNANDLQKKK